MKNLESSITGHLDIIVNRNEDESDGAREGKGDFYDRYIPKETSSS